MCIMLFSVYISLPERQTGIHFKTDVFAAVAVGDTKAP